MADGCYGAALLTLPLVGVGLVHLVSGVDLGAGLQPAYLLLALAWGLRLWDLSRPHADRDRQRFRQSAATRRGFVWTLIGAAVVLLSGLGLVLAPAPLLGQEAWPRFGKQILQLGIMVACLGYPALWTRGPRRWRWTVTLLAWAVGAQIVYSGLLAVHQLTGLPGFDLVDGVFTSNPAILAGSDQLYLGGFTALPRLRGTMSEPLYLGSLLVGFLPLLAAYGHRRLAALGAVVLLLTWSRGAWVAGGCGLAAWWIMHRCARLPGPSRRWFFGAIGGAALAMLVITLMAGPDALLWPLRRLIQTFDRGDWSNLTRYYSFQAAWRCFLESPLVGVGWGQYPYHFYALVDLPGLDSQFTWPVVNSVPLLVLSETGVLGLGFLVAVLVAVWRLTGRVLASEICPARRARLAALAAGGFGLGVQLLVFSQYNLPHLWVLSGLWLAALAEAPMASERRQGAP